MKKIILFLLATLVLFCACDNKLEDELFTKHVLINQNGFREYNLNYVNTSVKDTVITVAINGSSRLDRDITVNLAINPDTLAGYNWEKYRNDRSRYYELLPEECYSFVGEGILIKAGTEYTNVPIQFYLDKIDKEKNYVLPISIISTSEYQVGAPQYSTVLMNIVLSNDYTGTYALSGRVQEIETGDFMDVRMTRTLRVVDPVTVSLFASNTSERVSNREDYRINMMVNPDSTLTITALHPDLIELTCDTPNLDPKNPRNKIQIARTIDVQNSHKVYVVTTFYMFYKYVDKTDPTTPIEIRWEGTCSRSKTIFTK
ncbi:MAG: DUF4361 domain-containing protein [Alistipes sp.]